MASSAVLRSGILDNIAVHCQQALGENRAEVPLGTIVLRDLHDHVIDEKDIEGVLRMVEANNTAEEVRAKLDMKSEKIVLSSPRLEQLRNDAIRKAKK